MGLTTHVLDTMHGTPAGGMGYELWALDAAGAPQRRIASCSTTADGREASAMLVVTSPRLAGFAALVIPLVLVPMLLFGRRVRGLSRQNQDRIADTTADGRAQGGPLIADGALVPGRYRLVFEVAAYFRARGVALPDPPFLDVVTLDFGAADAKAHYHVPLLVSPWSYSTYRGS